MGLKITENLFHRMVDRTLELVNEGIMNEFNGSDAIERYEQGYGDLEGNQHDFEDPAGMPDEEPDFKGEFRDGFRREGSIEDTYLRYFQNVDELKSFLTEFGDKIDMPDECQEIINRLEDFEEQEKDVTGW